MKLRVPGSRGLALIAVLWIVAALSIAAMGLIHSAKLEIRKASHYRAIVEASALGDAANRLVLREIVTRAAPFNRSEHMDVQLAGRAIRVRVQSLNGLVDINNAAQPLLAALFQHAAGATPAEAAALAQKVVEWRKRPATDGALAGFDAPEDLLAVPGFDYALYARIEELVSTSLRGGGLVNPEAAPLPVLVALAEGNIALARQLDAQRKHSPLPMDTTSLNPGFKGGGSGGPLIVVAEVPMDGALALERRWSVALTSSGRNGLPWRVIEQHQRLVQPGT